MKSLSSFCKVDVELVVMKNSWILRVSSGDSLRLFMAVFTVSIFVWNSDVFLPSSDRYKAILPIMSPFIIELTMRIGTATSISSYVLGHTSPTPKR